MFQMKLYRACRRYTDQTGWSGLNWSDVMIEIAAVMCMFSSPEQCRDISLNFEAETVSPASCMMNGQMELAKWSEVHPGWRVARWSCRPAGQVAKL
jgi:hypothetical protein